jgi:prefoldin subunit 5
MAISNSSKAILNVELARLRGEKQRVQKLIDDLRTQGDSLKAEIMKINSAIDKIKGDIDAL